jgi:hypothetical protein
MSLSRSVVMAAMFALVAGCAHSSPQPGGPGVSSPPAAQAQAQAYGGCPLAKAYTQPARAADDVTGIWMKDECAKGQTCKFKCTQGKCEYDCKANSTCKAKCSGGKCDFSCKKNATCKFTCSGGKCKQKCGKSSKVCKTTCSGGGCKQTCNGGTCKLTCSGGGCTQFCAPGALCKKTCTGGGCK